MAMQNWTINTSLSVNYEIKNVSGIFSQSNDEILKCCSNKKAFIVVDKVVNNFYSKIIENYFESNHFQYQIIVVDGVESEKNLENLIFILKEMEKFGVLRLNEPIIGIGGGVILDLVGLAANLYRRGVPYIKIPTTLLGIIDVSVAAKTGINFEDRRNRLGSYYPPIITFLDKSFLKTVPFLEISSGLGEILKMGVIKTKYLFEMLETSGKILLNTKFDCDKADEIIGLSIQGMKEELENNLWEKDLKRIVDFGHTFSPIIEMRSLNSNKPLTHGQAVTLDIIFCCVISHLRNMLSLNDVTRVINTAKILGLPVFHESFVKPQLLLESLQDTVKHRNGNQNLPVPKSIGEAIFINDLTYDEICKAVILFQSLTK